jgi:hypothetical protein
MLGTRWLRSKSELAFLEAAVLELINDPSHVDPGQFAVAVPLQRGFSLGRTN